LHQVSPQPTAPSSSSTRTKTAGRSRIVPNEVRTGVSIGQRNTIASRRAIRTEISGKGGNGWTVDTTAGINVWSMVRLTFCRRKLRAATAS